MRIEVRCLTFGRYETAIADEDHGVATFKLRTHYSVTDVDATIRSEIKRANAWSSLRLPIVVEGAGGAIGRDPSGTPRRSLADHRGGGLEG